MKEPHIYTPAHDPGRAPIPVSRGAWEAFRAAFRSLGPCHARVDRWRYDLKWNVPEHVVAKFLAQERKPHA